MTDVIDEAAVMDPPAETPVNGERNVFSLDALRGLADVPTQWCDVPEWGGGCYVRGMTGTERDAFEKSLMVGKGRKADINLDNFRAKLVARVATDADGQRLFSDADAGWLGTKSAKALQRIFMLAQEMSGISDSDVDEMETTLGEGQSAGSGSA